MDRESSVKSAKRVFEFLEYMAKVRRQVSVGEIAKHYSYPNSSVSSVMRTMVSLGYLSYDTSKRTYLPTVRLPFLVNWIGTELFHHSRMKRLMEDLSESTGETILLAAQSGLMIQYIQVIEAKGQLRLHVDPGSFRPLVRTAVGLMLMSQHTDHKAANMVRRINNEETDATEHIDVRQILDQLEEIRRQGYAMSIGGIVPGGGALAMLLPESMNGQPLSIAIGSSEINLRRYQDEWLQILRQAIDRTYAAGV